MSVRKWQGCKPKLNTHNLQSLRWDCHPTTTLLPYWERTTLAKPDQALKYRITLHTQMAPYVKLILVRSWQGLEASETDNHMIETSIVVRRISIPYLSWNKWHFHDTYSGPKTKRTIKAVISNWDVSVHLTQKVCWNRNIEKNFLNR